MGCCSSKPRDRYKISITKPSTNDNLIAPDELTGDNMHFRKRLKHSKSEVFGKASEEAKEAINARVSMPAKSDASDRLISEALKQHVIFNSLSAKDTQSAIAEMQLYRLSSGETVFEQGMPSCNFYIVAAGRLEAIVNRRRVGTFKAGDTFGELDLLQNLPRSATIKTVEACELWVLDSQAFNVAIELANATTHQETKEFLEGVTAFQCISKTQLESLAPILTVMKFADGAEILREADTGNLFFIILEGTVMCSTQSDELRRLYRGDFFGEQALLYNCSRTATCTAIGPVRCLATTKSKLVKALGASLSKIIYKNSLRIAFSRSQVLAKLTSDQQEKIIGRMEIRAYKKYAVVIESGTKMSRKLWIVVKGCLANEGSSSAFAGLYIAVGDQELLTNDNGSFMVNILAKDDSDVAEISKTDLERVIGWDLKTAALSNSMADALKRAEIFHSLSAENLQRLSSHLTVKQFTNGEVIVEQGSRESNFYVIKEGTVDIIKDGNKVRSITMLDYFGERSILTSEARSADVVARGNVTCWLLSRESFNSVVSQKVIDSLKQRINLQDESVTLDQLVPVEVIGQGSFGMVTLVAHKLNSSLFALKSVPKAKLSNSDLRESLLLERQILGLLNHAFILKSIKSFEDAHHLYSLTEFVRGSDLFAVLRQIGLLGDADAKFYTASLILVLEHLHERSIVYRDLKPENIIVDHQGYVKLIDFGTARIISDRTFTLLGTPHYMAPEVILGKGYDCLADYWSLGVMLYEFVCGMVPFGDDLRNPYDVYESVLSGQLLYPRYTQVPFPSQSLVEQLLSKHPPSRLGGSSTNIKHHKWFRSFDWEGLTDQAIKPPVVPEAKTYSEQVRKALSNKQSVHEFLQLEARHESDQNLGKRMTAL